VPTVKQTESQSSTVGAPSSTPSSTPSTAPQTAPRNTIDQISSLEGAAPVHLGRRYRLLVALPVLAVVVFAAAFWHFVKFAIMANPALNGLIFAVMSWGALTMFGHVARVYREDAVFRYGLQWLRPGAEGSGPTLPRPQHAYVLSMIDRLSKMG
jgi:hypothetical protein